MKYSYNISLFHSIQKNPFILSISKNMQSVTSFRLFCSVNLCILKRWGRSLTIKLNIFLDHQNTLDWYVAQKLKKKPKFKDVRKCKNSRLGGMHWIKYDKHCVKHLISILKVAYTSPILGSKSKCLMFYSKTFSMKVEMNKVDWSH